MGKENYTAILHIHGIGQRARHDDVGSLMDALEAFEGEGVGELLNFDEGIEPSRTSSNSTADVPFTRFNRIERAVGKHRFRGNFRAYEVYWSSITGQGQSVWRMLFWLLQQPFVPVRYYFASWRFAFRLRIARLHYLEDKGVISEASAVWLLSQFKRFLGPTGRRETPQAEFLHFREYLLNNSKGREASAVAALAHNWEDIRSPAESTANILIWFVFGLALSVCLWAVALLRATHEGIIHWSEKPFEEASILHFLGDALPIVGLLLTAGIVGLILWFLTRTASDIRLWASIRENDSNFRLRRAIIDLAKDAISHVAKDDLCNRIVIVAHSLGTSIAFDALRELGQFNRAREKSLPHEVIKLSKISHLITLGSPIDKIAYFFESKDSSYYRANRVRETVRGDLAREPFFRNGKQQLAWINFWDDADIISDPLFSPLTQKHDGGRFIGAKIQNIRIATKVFPNPYATHRSYLQNRSVVGAIFGAAFLNDATRYSAIEDIPILLQRWPNKIMRYVAKFGFVGFVAISVILPFCLLRTTSAWVLDVLWVAFGLLVLTNCICWIMSNATARKHHT